MEAALEVRAEQVLEPILYEAAVVGVRERLAELDGIETDLREQRAAIEGAGAAMATWVELLGRAEVEPDHLAAARRFLGRVLVGPIAVSPTDYGWSFEGRSRLDGRLLGFLDGGPEPMMVVVRTGRPAISGGSDAPGVVGTLHDPEMAPIPPCLSSRPGTPGALLGQAHLQQRGPGLARGCGAPDTPTDSQLSAGMGVSWRTSAAPCASSQARVEV